MMLASSVVLAASFVMQSGHSCVHATKPFGLTQTQPYSTCTFSHPRASTSMGLRDEWHRFACDLNRDDWSPLAAEPTWLNPCFFTCMITAASVQRAAALGLFPFPLGLGPLLVLLSSVTYWCDPRRETWRRSLDVITVRIGMSSQVLIAILLCVSGHLPPVGVILLLSGYAAALQCYAAGRVLTVRGHRLAGAWVHGGLHLFSNLGNICMLPLVNI